jgi:hypothetical protein
MPGSRCTVLHDSKQYTAALQTGQRPRIQQDASATTWTFLAALKTHRKFWMFSKQLCSLAS